jgi:tetratricopeptide (TPR) repeat protein
MMKRKILKVFLVSICYAVFFYSTTAFGIDWEQWRIPNDGQDNSSGGERPAPRQEREDTRKREAFKLNKKGNQAYKAGKWKEAIDYYKKALRKSPNDRVIRQNLTNAQITLSGKKENWRTGPGTGKKQLLITKRP